MFAYIRFKKYEEDIDKGLEILLGYNKIYKKA